MRCAMSELLSAVYESGAFHPAIPPQLDEGECVEILVRPRRLLKPQAVAAELAGAAAMPVACPGDPRTGQNHDRTLYGEAHAS